MPFYFKDSKHEINKIFKYGKVKCIPNQNQAILNDSKNVIHHTSENLNQKDIQLIVRNDDFLIFDTRIQIECNTNNDLTGGYSIEWIRTDRKMPSASYIEGKSLIINR